MKRKSLIVFFVLAACGLSFGDSEILEPMTGQANDILTDYYFGGYDVVSDGVVGWGNNSLQKVTADGTVTLYSCGTPADYSGYNSFVRQDPSGTSAWVGFTVGDNSDDRIYQVDYATGKWTHMATMAGNFDLEFSGNNAFVSGLNSTDWSDPTCIWLLDTSGGNNHDLIVEMGGNSAGLAFDNAGNAVYASYDGELYTWSSSDIAGAIGAGNLTYLDGTKLSDLECGAYDIDVDDAGNIIFNGNGSYSYTAIWNGVTGDGFNYDYLSTGSGEYGNWHSFIDSMGDVSVDGTYYQADFYTYGIAQVVVPEPATLSLLGLGAVLFAGRRKR